MEFADACKFFDDQPVLDGYSGALLFYGQPDLFDAAERDSETGWRRTLSAAALTFPARNCVQIGTDRFIAGRSVKDYFQGAKVREHMLLHPADYLVTASHPAGFLGAIGSFTLYAGLSWLKERKEEARTSEAFSVYDIYCSTTEAIVPGMLIKTPAGVYLRVQGIDQRSGGLLVLVSQELGADAQRSVSYIVAGAYDPATDSSSASAPIAAAAFVEPFVTNYNYMTNGATPYEKADRVVTVRAATVATPKPGDTLVDQSLTFQVLEKQDDGNGCWELHVRPV